MNWTRGHNIGHGSTAVVSIAMSHCSGEIFAVKSSELSRSGFLQKEHKILSTLNSPYVVDYKGYDVTRENNSVMFNLMMEYMPDGTLIDEIRKQGGRLNEQLTGYCTKQIVQGLDYLHSKDIVHCDIKGHNILLGKTGAKIADFGCSKQVEPAELDSFAVPIGGTPMYMAPEVARGVEQEFPADIWALGCTIIEMATGGSPWTSVNNSASLLYYIAFSSQTPEIPKFLSSQARDFLSKCLIRNPKQRWSAKQLLNHPFLEELESYDKSNEEFITNSPTSMLDQGIWNSVEESESIDDSTQNISSMDLPLQRVRNLGLHSGKSGWRWDESWITVRNCNDDGNVICGMTDFSSTHGMELESCFGSDMVDINCKDNIISCWIQHRAVTSNLNFDTHIRTPVNKVH
ncbi:mitogen-activated protein kinase kinase kinase 18-like [Lycium barbarum]|uniref:mitogen-activated protein kinase kinase kinase 18-like n=1 Tax=Lycium barbarum TaxID=112863 RepID=UPI00293E87D7|nr:mitogen-activated protein kinase kinase kinase 18-like [Lycium barbarum]